MEKKHFVGIEHAQKITGFTKSSIYQLTSKKQIPHYRFRGRLRFLESELLDWISSHRVEVQEVSHG